MKFVNFADDEIYDKMENISHQDNIENVLESLGGLTVKEIDLVLQNLIKIRRQKLPSVLSEKESELIKKINRQLPEEIRSRYNILLNKKESQSLSDQEYAELLELTRYAEQFDVDRLKHLSDLARLRNISLAQLIDDLELKPVVNVS